MLLKRKHLLRQELLFLDIVCVLFAYFLSAYLQGGLLTPDFLNGMYGSTLFIIVLTYMAIFLFREEEAEDVFRRGFLAEIYFIVKDQIKVGLVLLLFLFVTQLGIDYSRFFFVVFFLLSTLFIYIERSYFKLGMMTLYRNSSYSRKVHVITIKDLAEDCIHDFKEAGLWDMKIESLCIIDEDMQGRKILDIPVIANRENVVETIQRGMADHIFIHLPNEFSSKVDIRKLVLNFEKMGLTIHMVLNNLENISIENKRIGNIAGYSTVSYSSNLFNGYQMFIKRVIDILGSLVGLLFTGILTLILAPIIMIEDPGPIFFSQIRIGKNGRRFKIYKFRSMVKNAEKMKQELMSENEMDGLMFKMENDPRVTRIGRFMRKTSLDEFPQFLNVLLGDMSLVGPRPPTEDEFEEYSPVDRRRVSIRPGITGLWQVSGRSSITDFDEVVKLDLEYIDNWSISYDFSILLKTVWVVLTGKGSC